MPFSGSPVLILLTFVFRVLPPICGNKKSTPKGVVSDGTGIVLGQCRPTYGASNKEFTDLDIVESGSQLIRRVQGASNNPEAASISYRSHELTPATWPIPANTTGCWIPSTFVSSVCSMMARLDGFQSNSNKPGLFEAKGAFVLPAGSRWLLLDKGEFELKTSMSTESGYRVPCAAWRALASMPAASPAPALSRKRAPKHAVPLLGFGVDACHMRSYLGRADMCATA